MTQSIVTTIKNGKITLPKGLQKEWGTDEVMFVPSQDGAYIKPIVRPSLASIRPKLKKLGKMISNKDIADAVAWARQKTYGGRA